MPNYTFIAETARKLERKSEKDKTFPTVNIFYVKFEELPGSKDDVNKNIPSEVNIRTTADMDKTVPKKSVYGQIEQSIKSLNIHGEFSPETNLPGFFVYRNKGISIAAKNVHKISPNEEKYEIEISDVEIHGIFDGGHTYKTILENREKEDGSFYDECVKLEVFTGFENVNNELDSVGNKISIDEVINQVARGQNTTVQVTEDSIADNLGLFDPIKKVLETTIISDDIAYEQNSSNPIKAKELTAHLMAMNIKAFTNKFVVGQDNSHPIASATSIAKPLAEYIESMRSKKDSEYYQLIKKLPQILYLLEIIKVDGAREYLERSGLDVPKKMDVTKKNGWFEKGIEEYSGVITFARKREKGKIIPDENKFDYKLVGLKSSMELKKGCYMPLLAAFRNMLFEKEDGSIEWDGGFDSAIKLWQSSKYQLLTIMIEHAGEGGGAVHRSTQLSKKSTLWRDLHSTVRELKHSIASSEDPLLIK